MIKKLAENVWKIQLSSNLYLLDIGKLVVIDTGDRKDRQQLLLFLERVVEPAKVDIVVFTHLHYDHIGNFDLFKNAWFYASRAEIMDFKRDAKRTVLREDIAGLFDIELLPVETLNLKQLEFVLTPGHTRGSICIWYPKHRILFSGDTLFNDGFGRTDLPTSDPAAFKRTLLKLTGYNFKILAPGHG
ncbi:hypothetical protein DRJ48_03860 [Candidatus Woesearchaeota archaeon]|nr:MAG: hypothetical protein DRJ48_03860 [Candidatus Woesearchaeota archaeon]